MPTFTIIAAPPGSGKGKVPFLLYPNENIKYNLIDDLIEANTEFETLTSNYVKNNYTVDEIIELENDIDAIVYNIKNNIQTLTINKLLTTSKILSDIYFTIRNDYKLDSINNNLMKKYIADNNNIVFETTCINDIEWLFTDDYLNNKQYNTVLVYPFVDTNIIIKQIITRFIDQAKKILETNSYYWCRMPNLQNIVATIATIKTNISDICSNALTKKNYIDKIIICDNWSTKQTKKMIIFETV